MSEWKQDPITLQATAVFTPPPNLLDVAARELPRGAFARLLAQLCGEPLTAEVYVKFIEEIRNESRL